MTGKGNGQNEWKTSTSQALSKVCRKRWRTLELAAGSPTPPMRINCANALLGGELYLFGGLNAGPSKSLWALNIRERRWRPVHPRRGQAPDPRQGHSMCWDGLSSLWVFGGQGTATSKADSSRTHQGVKIRTLAKRTCFNDFFEFDTKKREWRDHVQAGVCPTSRRGHTATLVVGRRIVDNGAGPQQTEQSCDVNDFTSPAGGRAGVNGAEPGTSSGTGDGDTRSQARGEAEGGGGHNSCGSTTSITPRFPNKATPKQDDRQDLGGSSPRRAGVGSSRKGGGADSVAGGTATFEDQPRESREMFVIGGAGTDPIRNMEVVYPQLWIFNFSHCAWTCVEAAGVGRGVGGGGKSKGLGTIAATGDGGGGGSGGGGGGGFRSGSASGPGPPAVFDHTATLVGGKHIIVIGGIMVGKGLNSEVYMLNLDTLQWVILDTHPLGFPAPAIHGHTTVEDPARGGRLIVFGGQGGDSWNTQVLTCDWKKNMWSIALCDTETQTPHDEANVNNISKTATYDGKDSNGSRGNDPRRGNSLHRVTILDDPVIGRTDVIMATPSAANDSNYGSGSRVLGRPGQRPGTGNSDGCCSSAPTSILAVGGSSGSVSPGFDVYDSSTAVVDAAKVAMVKMPYQRHGHTCFVWDPRDTARTRDDAATYRDNSLGRGGRGPSVSLNRKQSNSKQSRRGGSDSVGRSNGGGPGGGSGRANTVSSKRSRGGGGEDGSKTGLPAPSRGKGQGGASWNRTKQAPFDESLPSPCIVAFGGSALRTGGGYAQAELNVLETTKPEGGGDDAESEGDEGGGGILEALEASANTRRQSFNRFQTCTKSVLLKVHSLRQLGKEKLAFGDSYDPGDLSYIEFKVRSVIFGEGSKRLEGAVNDSDRNDQNKPATVVSRAFSMNIEDADHRPEKPPHPGAGRLGVFPTGYEQVKAFLADARPANSRRPVSAPAHIESGDGSILSLDVAGSGGAGGMARGRARGGAGTHLTRRPGTAGAVIGSGRLGGFGDENQRPSLPPVDVSAHTSSSSSLAARPGSKTATTAQVGEGRIPVAAAAPARSTAKGHERGRHHPNGGVANSSALFSHRSVRGGGGGGTGGNGAEMAGRVPMQGSRSIVLPKPTMAAHNGRLFMQYQWANAGFY